MLLVTINYMNDSMINEYRVHNVSIPDTEPLFTTWGRLLSLIKVGGSSRMVELAQSLDEKLSASKVEEGYFKSSSVIL